MPRDSAKSAFVLIVGLVFFATGLVAERFGAGADVIRPPALGIAAILFAIWGILARTQQADRHFVGGRNISQPVVAALFACLLAAGSAIGAPAGALIAPATAAALCLGALFFAATAATPLAQARGRSFADAISERYGSRLLGTAAGLSAFGVLLALASLTGHNGARLIQQATGLAAGASAITAAGLIICTAFLAGYGGLAATAAFCAGLGLAVWLAPLAYITVRGGPDAALNGLTAALNSPALPLADTAPDVSLAGMTLAFAGVFALLHAGAGARTIAAARTAPALGVLLAAALAVLAAFSLLPAQRGAMPVSLIVLQGAIIPFMTLVATGLLAHVAAAALTQDVVFRLIMPRATTSARMAVHRLVFVVIVLAATGVRDAIAGALDQWMPAVIFVAAAIPVPLLVLGRVARADWKAALFALFGAFCVAAACLEGQFPAIYAPPGGFAAALITGWAAAKLFGPRP